MKVVTIGLTPFLMASRSKVHSLILRYLYLTGKSVACLAWGHSEDFFIPEEDDRGNKFFFYDFDYESDRHKVPLFPFHRGEKESIAVYEYLNQLKPDIIITVGDVTDFPYMHAVKSFYTANFRWLHVMLHYNSPISEHNTAVIQDMDGILCSSQFAFDSVKDLYTGDIIETHLVGSNPKLYKVSSRNMNYRVMSCAKVSQSDCGPTVMEAVAGLSPKISDISLYMHSNVYDTGEHDFAALKDRFDPSGKIISFPDKYVSLLEGVPESEMAYEYANSDIFVSIPMIAATSMSVYQAIGSGCFPVMSACGSNIETAKNLAEHLGEGFAPEDFLLPTIRTMAAGDTYLGVCGKDDLQKKILSAYEKMKKHKGLRTQISQFTQKYTQGSFLEKVADMVDLVLNSNTKMCLESV